jgi:ribosomal protein L37E
MSEEHQPGQKNPQPTRPVAPVSNRDKMLCERCGEEMYRMHAVWRCPACGFKTDCCGW